MRKLYVYFTILCVATIMIGCQTNSPSPKEKNNQQVDVEQSSYEPDRIKNTSDIADHLANIANKVPNVHDAAAVVAGPYAVIAINLSKDVERQEAGKIKFAVHEAMEHDPYGRSAVVIADADMYTRLKEMKNAIKNGAATEGITDELGNIVSRYMPTLPMEMDKQPTDPYDSDMIENNKGLE